jgi:Leucine-rich repeat (LRR) protein
MDLSPLTGMPLKTLSCFTTGVSDLTPLAGMPLQSLTCFDTPVSDLTPLAGMKLTNLRFTPKNITRGLDVVRGMTTLTTLGIDGSYNADTLLPPAEFWKKFDAGEFGKPGATTDNAWNTPEFRQWVADVQKLPAEQQLEAVSKKLMELNPGFDGRLVGATEDRIPKIVDGAVAELGLINSQVTDISPLSALSLRHLTCSQTKVSDLSPLRGMQRLEKLYAGDTGISDLSPLIGLPLRDLELQGTQVFDLAIVRGMPLTRLLCQKTKVTDLSPLRGMPFKVLYCDFVPERDTETLRTIATLERINGLSAAEFWRQVEAGNSPPAASAGESNVPTK